VRDVTLPSLPKKNTERGNADNTHSPSEWKDIKNKRYNEPLPNIWKSSRHWRPANLMANND
jgi:hypothetical protein